MANELTQQKPARRPRLWWKSALKSLKVTTITALLAASLPVASSIRECGAKERELAVARAQQELATRKTYLDLALDPARPAELRQSVLRFLVDTSEDQRVVQWARTELGLVERRAEELRADLKKLQDLLAKQQEDVTATIVALQRERQARKLDAQSLAEARDKIAELDRSRVDLESRIASLRERLSGDVAPRTKVTPPADPFDNTWAEEIDKRKLKKTMEMILLDSARKAGLRATDEPQAPEPH